MPDYEKQIKIYVQENEAELQDNWFNFHNEPEKKNFIGVQKTNVELLNNTSSNIVISAIFTKDYDYQSYERSVFSFLDLTGNLGGLFEIMEIIGGIIVGIFADKLFSYSIISSLYQVDPLSNEELNEKAEQEQVNFQNKYLNTEVENKVDSEIRMDEESKNINQTSNSLIQRNELNLQTLTKMKARHILLSKAKVSMMNRRSYNYSLLDFGYNLL